MTRNARRRLSHDVVVALQALGAGLPGVVLALGYTWTRPWPAHVRLTVSLAVVLPWLTLARAVQARVARRLRSLASVAGALCEGDYRVRLSGDVRGAPLGQVQAELNALAAGLREERLGHVEAAALYRSVVGAVDAAVLAFDEQRRLRLVNRAGERLLGRRAAELIGQEAEQLGLGRCLSGTAACTMEATFRGAAGRFGLRRTTFRSRGRAHRLVVLSDLSRTLREEEHEAWRRLVRVLSHELNNSLAPIQSLAGTLGDLLARGSRPPDWLDDMRSGLAVIRSRAGALGRFISAHARLAKLPEPRPRAMSLRACVLRVVGLETRLDVRVLGGPEVTLVADTDQLEQALINLVGNAVDAVTSTGGGVSIGWHLGLGVVELSVEDEGIGLAGTANLFVPFYTTKPGGSGIGLVLSRQVVESHGGSLELANRPGGGCLARVRLPVHATPRSKQGLSAWQRS